MTTSKPEDQKIHYHYCVLWIPTLFHDNFQPVGNDGIVFTVKGKDDKLVNAERIFKKDEDGYIDPNKNIEIKNVLFSDDASKEIYLDLVLLEENEQKKADRINNQNKKKTSYIAQRNIRITARDENGKVIDKLNLECLNARRNGLFLYRYKLQEEYKGCLLDSKNKITDGVYHAIKTFYHKHLYHSSNVDSLFRPFCDPTEIDLTSSNNAALFHYLEEFEQYFFKQLDFIRELKSVCYGAYSRAKEKKESLDEKEELSAKDKEEKRNATSALIRALRRFQDCLDDCSTTLCIHVFYQALFYSKYNKDFVLRPNGDDPFTFDFREQWQSGRIDSKVISLTPIKEKTGNTSEENSLKRAYKKAINIHTTIESIRILKRQMANFLNSEFSELTLKSAEQVSIQSKSIISQTDKIDKQTGYIKNQTDKIDSQTKEIKEQSLKIENLTTEYSDLSSKLTKRTAFLGIIVGLVSSTFFFFLSTKCSGTHSEKDCNNIDSTRTVVQQQLKEQENKLKQQSDSISELKKLIIDLSKSTTHKKSTRNK